MINKQTQKAYNVRVLIRFVENKKTLPTRASYLNK